MARRDSTELLFDSEATLRLVDGVLTDLGRHHRDATFDAPTTTVSPRVVEPSTERGLQLETVEVELTDLLARVRMGRADVASRALKNLYGTSERLDTQSSATAMLNRVGHALRIIDVVESGGREWTLQSALHELRHELFGIVSCLQFQASTANQLEQTSAVLHEVETRITELTIALKRTPEPRRDGQHGVSDYPGTESQSSR